VLDPADGHAEPMSLARLAKNRHMYVARDML
jgi:hypothetical protein